MSFAIPNSAPGRRPLVGRERERQLLFETFDRGSRLISLTGPAGIGKSRLAAHFTELLSISGRADVALVPLVHHRNREEIEAAVATALGGSSQGGLAPSGRGRLLVLDGVELQALGPTREFVASWLGRWPELRILLTSLHPLGIDGEVEHPLGQLEERDAIALYLERTHRVWANRSLAKDDEEAIAELVRRLDRLPLAIELAAARVRLFPPRTLLAWIDNRFQLLRSAAAEPARSLEAAMRSTWESLSAQERSILSMASAFEGGFTREAAAAVLGERQGGEGEIPAVLERLRAKAILDAEDGEDRRYRLMESLQLFARDELHARGLWEEAIDRHAAYVLGSGERLVASSQESARASRRWLEVERSNLLAIHLRFREEEPARSARSLYSRAKGRCSGTTRLVLGYPYRRRRCSSSGSSTPGERGPWGALEMPRSPC